MAPLPTKQRASRAGRQRKLKTAFLRVPARDWGRIVSGDHREFRVAVGAAPAAYGFGNVTIPLPLFVVIYRTNPELKRLMVLEEVRRERLIEITDEGLAAAGYTGPRDEAFARFRRDWVTGEKKRFEPAREVVVFRTSRPTREDIPAIGANLVNHLYGDYLASEEL